MEKLNLGCGSQYVDGWINVDYSVGARAAKIPFFSWANQQFHLFDIQWDNRIVIHNLTKKFPWPDHSIDIIYTSHLLEHFSKDEGHNFINECYRVIKPDGILRIVVPDLSVIIKNYISGNLRADHFIDQLGVLTNTNPNKFKNMFSSLLQFPHKCMYDNPTLTSILSESGFSPATKNPFESEIKDINLIELESRARNAVIIEATKT